MTPIFAPSNAANRLVFNAKEASYFSLRHGGRQSFNYSNLYLIKFRPAVVLPLRIKPNLGSVAGIFQRRHILKICRMIISFVAVNMINVQPLRTRADESRSNESVDSKLYLFAGAAQANSGVAVAVQAVFQQTPRVRIRSGFLSPHSAKIRHAVDAFVTNYVAPFFGLKFFGGKVLVSHEVHSPNQSVNRLARLAWETQSLVRAVSILPRLAGSGVAL